MIYNIRLLLVALFCCVIGYTDVVLYFLSAPIVTK
jgi:hypothetical protein